MRVIDLLVELNNFNNGKTAKLPKKIKLYENIYELKKDGYDNHYYYDGNLYTLIKDLDDTCDLNSEIEIIEEDKKIEKFEFGEIEDQEHYKIKKKINDIIDKLNEMEENK